MAKRILSKVSNESNPGLTLHKVNLDATPVGDVNVTRRSNSSSRMEQQPVESGNEEIGSSMQRIASNLMQTGNQFLQSKESEEANTTESHGVQQITAPGYFENLMEFFVKQS